MTSEVISEHEGVRLRAFGSLDLATQPLLETQIEELLESGVRTLTLDLRAVTFMDSSGVRLVLRWNAAAQSGGFQFWVIPGPPQVQRVFELTDTGRLVAFKTP